MFYNTYRPTKAANSERLKLGQTGQSILANPRKRLINLQKRQKLKDLLITKFMQKYGIKHPEQYLENEIKPLLDDIEIRGIGMIWGIDVKTGSKAKAIVDKCFEKGLVIERAGRDDSVVKIMPQLLIDDETLLKGLTIIKDAIKENI